MKNLITFTTLILLFSCHPQDAISGETNKSVFLSGETISKEDTLTIKKNFQGKDIFANDTGDKDPYWTPEFLLPKLNPWFKVGNGLKRAKLFGGNFLIYELKTIPEALINELENSLLENDYSLSLISSSFWKLIKNTQDSGIKIGFISSSSPFIANGVYFRDLNLIGIHILASNGTLPHELRHSKQYKRINQYYSPKNLSRSCFNSLSSAFGEIDATTSELNLHALKADHIEDLFNEPRDFKYNKFPEITDLTVNLEYPATVSFNVRNNQSCPEKIRNEMGALSSYFSQKSELITESFNKLPDLIAEKGKKLVWIESNCKENGKVNCNKFQSRLDQIESDYPIQKSLFKKQIEEEVLNRPKRITETLLKFDYEILTDLCNGALGVSYYINCEKYL